jgi:hypothetical protein
MVSVTVNGFAALATAVLGPRFRTTIDQEKFSPAIGAAVWLLSIARSTRSIRAVAVALAVYSPAALPVAPDVSLAVDVVRFVNVAGKPGGVVATPACGVAVKRTV